MSVQAGEDPVIIVGAGLAGLACALDLQAEGIECSVLEASDGAGGRVRTDEVDGFRLDRGFQILLTAYPEAQRYLDYEALDLQPFYPGALVRRGGRFVRIADPLRRPLDGLKSLWSPLGSLRDKLRVLRLRRASRRGRLDELFARPETTTDDALRNLGFSETMREGFLRPWLSGVFLERELRTSSRMLEFVVRMFAEGDNVVPAEGMGRITEQMASRLPMGTVRTHTPVERVVESGVITGHGERVPASRVVVATEGPAAARLLAGAPDPGSRLVQCVYFAAERDPVGEPTLVLDGEGQGPVTNLAVMSAVSSAYAPEGAALISASIVGEHDAGPERLIDDVRRQLRGWFGTQVDGWRHLRTYRIPHALPERWSAPEPQRLPDGVLVAGDWCANPSIQGALESGRRAADAVKQGLPARV